MVAAQKLTASARRKNRYAPKPATKAATSCDQARMTGDAVQHSSSLKGEYFGQTKGTPAYWYGVHMGNRPACNSAAANRRAGSAPNTRSVSPGSWTSSGAAPGAVGR